MSGSNCPQCGRWFKAWAYTICRNCYKANRTAKIALLVEQEAENRADVVAQLQDCVQGNHQWKNKDSKPYRYCPVCGASWD